MILIIKIIDLIENSVFLFNAIYIRGSIKRNMYNAAADPGGGPGGPGPPRP